MNKITLKISQNGGEYYGSAVIKTDSTNVEIKGYRTAVLDNIEIEFDEVIELVSIKEYKSEYPY